MFYDSLLYKLTVEQHALAGCRIRVRTMEIAKGLHSSDEENVQIGVHRNQNLERILKKTKIMLPKCSCFL